MKNGVTINQIKVSVLCFLISMLIVPGPTGLQGETPEIPSVRNSGMGGIACAMVNNIDAVYQNPAGVIGINQSYLNQVLHLDNRTNNGFLSQTIILKLRSLPVMGATVSLLRNDRINDRNLSYHAFAAFPFLYVFSMGVSMNWYNKKQVYNTGLNMNIPFGGFINKIGIAVYGRNVNINTVNNKGFVAHAVENAFFGAHIQLKPDHSIFYNFTYDFGTVADYRKVSYKNSRKYIGFEQILKFDQFEIAWRAGTSLLKYKQSSITAGAGLKLDFLSIDVACVKMNKDINYSLSTSYKLNTKHVNNKKADDSVPPREIKNLEHAADSDASGIKCRISVYEDQIADRVYLLIDTDNSGQIKCWKIHLVDTRTMMVVKRYGDSGDPGRGFILDNEVLLPSDYRIELYYEGKNGSKGKTETEFSRS
ncbi:MAG: hypothetical protein PHF84_09805 [bacterium]|nr:hypothetical protein [bacterium]